MRVTTESEYALIIALHLAGKGSSEPGPVPARQVAEVERLPGEFVEQILIRLRRAGLVESKLGAHGGYRLARPASEISLHDLLSVTERKPFETACDRHPIDSERCGEGSDCSIRPVWFELQSRVDGFLRGVSLADLLRGEDTVRELVKVERN
jgi:Rrf2 family iron-sulfur cluster assembly transcriptional regulator